MKMEQVRPGTYFTHNDKLYYALPTHYTESGYRLAATDDTDSGVVDMVTFSNSDEVEVVDNYEG